MGAWRAPVGGILLVVFFSGCVESGQSNESAHAPSTHTTDAGQGTGQLSGFVVDVEQVGIEDALVELLRNETPIFNVTSDTVGEFFFTGLEEGAYVVRASKEGFLPSDPQSVFVRADNTTRVSLVLEPLPGIEPFHETKEYRVRFGAHLCWFVVGQPYGCFVAYGLYPENLTYAYPVNEDQSGVLKALIVELSWSPNVNACPARFRADVWSPQVPAPELFTDVNETTEPYHWDTTEGNGESPIHLYIPRNGTEDAMHSPTRTEKNGGKLIETSGTWHVTVRPYFKSGTLPPPASGLVDVACVVDQVATVHLTAFYGAPPPSPSWSALSE